MRYLVKMRFSLAHNKERVLVLDAAQKDALVALVSEYKPFVYVTDVSGDGHGFRTVDLESFSIKEYRDA